MITLAGFLKNATIAATGSGVRASRPSPPDSHGDVRDLFALADFQRATGAGISDVDGLDGIEAKGRGGGLIVTLLTLLGAGG